MGVIARAGKGLSPSLYWMGPSQFINSKDRMEQGLRNRSSMDVGDPSDFDPAPASFVIWACPQMPVSRDLSVHVTMFVPKRKGMPVAVSRDM